MALTRNAVLEKLVTSHHLVTIPWLDFKFPSPQSPPPSQMALPVSIPGSTWGSGQPRGSVRDAWPRWVREGGPDPVRTAKVQAGVHGTSEREMHSFFLPSMFPDLVRRCLGLQLLFRHTRATCEGRQELAGELARRWVLKTPFWGPLSSYASEFSVTLANKPHFS